MSDVPVVEPADEWADPTEFYQRFNGTPDALWMKPHHDFVMSLPLTDVQRGEVLQHMDDIYNRTIELAAEEAGEVRQLRLIFKEVFPDGFGV